MEKIIYDENFDKYVEAKKRLSIANEEDMYRKIWLLYNEINIGPDPNRQMKHNGDISAMINK